MKENNKSKYTLESLNQADIDLLTQASHVPEKTWFCFGQSYFKLLSLELVDNDNQVTYTGKQLLARLSKKYN